MSASLRTEACDLLGCEQPIVLAGMGGVARSELVSAVTRAGGFGFLGMVRESPSLIRHEVEAVRIVTSKRFGINLIPAATDPSLLEQQLITCIDLKIPVIALFWDLFPDIVGRLRDAGIIVVCQVGSVKEAEEAQKAGAQILIAQGVEAGGHVRGTVPLWLLLPEVVSSSHVPVLAAGGLVDGRDLVAALRLGAQGVVIGTAFLALPESFAHDYHKQRVIRAQPQDTMLTDIFHINWPIGARVRVLQNSVTRGERANLLALAASSAKRRAGQSTFSVRIPHCAQCRGTSREWHFTRVRVSAGSTLSFRPANGLPQLSARPRGCCESPRRH